MEIKLDEILGGVGRSPHTFSKKKHLFQRALQQLGPN